MAAATTAILQWSIIINLISKIAGFIYPRRNHFKTMFKENVAQRNLMIFEDFNDKIISNFWLSWYNHTISKWNYQFQITVICHEMHWTAIERPSCYSSFACFEYFRRVQNCNLLTLLFFLVSYTPLHTHILCKFGWLMVRETVQTVSGCPKSNYVSCHEK